MYLPQTAEQRAAGATGLRGTELQRPLMYWAPSLGAHVLPRLAAPYQCRPGAEGPVSHYVLVLTVWCKYLSGKLSLEAQLPQGEHPRVPLRGRHSMQGERALRRCAERMPDTRGMTGVSGEGFPV